MLEQIITLNVLSLAGYNYFIVVSVSICFLQMVMRNKQFSNENSISGNMYQLSVRHVSVENGWFNQVLKKFKINEMFLVVADYWKFV